MLRITQQSNAAAAKQYYSKADYLSEGQEIVGHWGGELAKRLGLDGVIDQHSFDRLCDNRDPLTDRPLTVLSKSERTVGYDFTWSVPKSVSLLYAMTSDRDVLDAFRESVHATMCDMEAEMKTRVRRNGKDENRTTGNMAWAEFIHTTARPVGGEPCPQLHAHCFVLNATWDAEEQRTKAGQFQDLKRDAPYFQAAFRVRLANELQDLGFAVLRKRDDFEIAGIPAATLGKFSRRTEEIEKVAAEKGITDPKRKAELGQETRERKSGQLSWNQLHKLWDSRLTQAEREMLAAVHRRESPGIRLRGQEAFAVDYALDHCYTRESVVAERKLLTEAMRRGVGAITVEGVRAELASRPLIRGEKNGRAVASTLAIHAEENKIVSYGRQGRGRLRPLGDPDRPFVREWLNDGQKAAVRHVLGSRDKITLVRGPAGTGKTTLEQELGDAFKEVGVGCVAIAQSASASRGVLREEAGFATADTVARFLIDERMQEQARMGVILLDEASLVGNKDALALFAAADKLDARIVMLGDRRQHRSVARGEPLKLLETEAGLPVAEVTEILRQKGDYKKVAAALSAGDTAAGFAGLDKLGWIREVKDGERYRALADAYIEAVAEKKRGGAAKTALVVSPTHAEAAKITQAIRAELKERGKLGEDHTLDAWRPAHLTDPEKADASNYSPGDLLQFNKNAPGIKNGSRIIVTEGMTLPLKYADRFEVYRPTGVVLAVGDRMRVTANGKSKGGRRINNGDLFTVEGFTAKGDPIVEKGRVIDKAFGHFAAGYVVTSHASQGRTLDKVFVGISSESAGATNRRSFYVPVTRGKEQAVVFTDDRAALLKAAQRDDEPMSATELVRSGARTPYRRTRLQKHLAFVRRAVSFGQLHEHGAAEQHRTHYRDREMGHAR